MKKGFCVCHKVLRKPRCQLSSEDEEDKSDVCRMVSQALHINTSERGSTSTASPASRSGRLDSFNMEPTDSLEERSLLSDTSDNTEPDFPDTPELSVIPESPTPPGSLTPPGRPESPTPPGSTGWLTPPGRSGSTTPPDPPTTPEKLEDFIAEGEIVPLGLEYLPLNVFEKIIMHLGPRELCRLECTSKRLKAATLMNKYWERLYTKRFFQWPLVCMAYGVYDYVPEFHYRLANFWKVSYRTFNEALHVRSEGTGGPYLPRSQVFPGFRQAATAGVRRSERPCIIFLHETAYDYGEWVARMKDDTRGIRVLDMIPILSITGHVTFMMFLQHDWYHYVQGQFYSTRGGYRVVWVKVAMMKHLGLELRRMLNPNFKEDPIRDERMGWDVKKVREGIRVRKFAQQK